MRLRPLFPIAILIAAALPSFADTTYTYTGGVFTSADAPYTTSDQITGTFTTSSPIPANTGNFFSGVLGTPILTVVSFSFSDGVDVISNTTADLASPIINIATDANGNIIAWQIEVSLFSGPDIYFDFQNPAGYGFNGNDGATDGTNYASGPHGSWVTTSGGLSPVPEPNSLALLGTGLVAVALFLRSRATED